MQYIPIFLFMVLIFGISHDLALAVETASEKEVSNMKTAGRTIVKGTHRVQEAFCLQDDLACLAKKVKNRTLEAKDATVDGTKEIINKID